jgi:hypothetical protein
MSIRIIIELITKIFEQNVNRHKLLISLLHDTKQKTC